MRPLTKSVPFFAMALFAGLLATGCGSGTGSSLTWLWVLVGVIVIIGVIVMVLVLRYMGERGTVVLGGWLAQAIDVYKKGSALHDAISAAVQPGALAAQDGAARWSDIQLRADDLAQELSALRAAAVEDDDRARAADALGSLQALRSALEAERDRGGGAGQAEAVRGRLAGFEKSLQALRAPERHLW
jgi:hypothetical protein